MIRVGDWVKLKEISGIARIDMEFDAVNKEVVDKLMNGEKFKALEVDSYSVRLHKNSGWVSIMKLVKVHLEIEAEDL